MTTPTQALQSYLIQNSIYGDALKKCTFFTSETDIIICCPDIICARFLSFHGEDLSIILRSLTNSEWLIIEWDGEEIDYIPITPKKSVKYMLASATKQIRNYPELLDIVRFSDYPTYVTVLPKSWEWEMPIRCVLTSEKVAQYAGRTPVDFHGSDISLLYDKDDLEKQIAILMREFERNNQNPVKISDLTYMTYLSDPTRKTLQKDPSRRYEYNADFEIQYIHNIGIVRICHCKERRPAFR